MHAVVDISGNQYLVSEGNVMEIPHLEGKEGENLVFPHVLLTFDEKNVHVGTPFVKGSSVNARIVKQRKGDKLSVRRFKSKVRYRKTRGFRPVVTDIEITSVA